MDESNLLRLLIRDPCPLCLLLIVSLEWPPPPVVASRCLWFGCVFTARSFPTFPAITFVTHVTPVIPHFVVDVEFEVYCCHHPRFHHCFLNVPGILSSWD